MTENLKTLDKKDITQSTDDSEHPDSQIIELTDDQLKDVVGGSTDKSFGVYNSQGSYVRFVL